MPISFIREMLEFQRDRLFLWLPVFFGVGVAIYFSLRIEPSTFQLWAIGAVGIVAMLIIRRSRLIQTAIFSSLMMVAFGYVYTAIRTNMIAAPVLSWHYYGAIEGRVIKLDRSASNAPRVLLDQVYLPGYSRERTPERVRLSLHGFIAEGALTAGERITLTGRLSPPSAPAEPGGFDFRRMAWFMQLGAVGYTRNPVIPAASQGSGGLRLWLFQQRMRLSKAIQAQIHGQNGAFAAAILTGDRSEIDPNVLENLRTTNLAHLLAISGLHMGLLSGFVFGFLRYGIALIPSVALRFQAKKFAAGIALLAGLAYLLLSGASVATQRAFIMTAVVLIAVILDRPAFTLRAVALAAFLVLLIKPYSLLEAGFQMSFAATTALIATYDWIRNTRFWLALNTPRWRFLRPFFALLLTSSVAGAATAPISAFYFNQMSQYGLLANLMAVPLMGMLVMPSAAIAVFLIPFGLEWMAFYIMGKGIGGILAIANYISNLEGAIIPVKSGPPIVLTLIAIGGLIIFLWRGKTKAVGFVTLATAIIIWINTPRPEFLVAEDGRMFGVISDQNRLLSKEKGNGYVAGIWLENDGDIATQSEAFLRDGIAHEGKLSIIGLKFGWRAVLYSGPKFPDVAEYCTEKTLLILPQIDEPAGDCTYIGEDFMGERGALSILVQPETPIIIGSRDTAQNRPWGY